MSAFTKPELYFHPEIMIAMVFNFYNLSCLVSFTWLGPIQGIPEFELVWVLLLVALQLLPDENVSLRLVGIQQGQFGVVIGVGKDRGDDLQHGRDAGAAGNHGDPLHPRVLGVGLLVLPDGEVAAALVDEESVGAPEVDAVADVHRLQVLSHLAAVWELGVDVLEVHLDDEVHVSELVVAGGGRVGPDDELTVDLGRQVDVLAHRKSGREQFDVNILIRSNKCTR